MIRAIVLFAAAGAAAYYYSRRASRRAALPEDLRLADEVRSKLAGLVADPEAVHVTVRRGTALLTGPVLATERDRILAAVLEVPGVVSVTNRLEAVEPVAAAL